MQGSNHTISTHRLVKVSGKETYDSTTTLSDIDVWIEQMNIQAAALWSGENALMMNLMIIDQIVDIKRSDRITDEDGIKYIVKDVEVKKGADVPSHMEVVVVRKPSTV